MYIPIWYHLSCVSRKTLWAPWNGHTHTSTHLREVALHVGLYPILAPLSHVPCVLWQLMVHLSGEMDALSPSDLVWGSFCFTFWKFFPLRFPCVSKHTNLHWRKRFHELKISFFFLQPPQCIRMLKWTNMVSRRMVDLDSGMSGCRSSSIILLFFPKGSALLLSFVTHSDRGLAGFCVWVHASSISAFIVYMLL